MHRSPIVRRCSLALICSAAVLASGCGLKEKFEERAAEELTERLMEGAGQGEIDVEINGDQVTIKDKKGNVVSADGKNGTFTVTEHGKDGDKTFVAKADEKTGTTTIKGSDGSEIVAGGKLPKDLPIELPEAREVPMAGRIKHKEGEGVAWTATMFSKSKDKAELVAHFKAQFEGKGLEPEVREQTGAIEMAHVQAEDKDKGLLGSANIIKVANEKDDHAGHFMIQFMWQDKNAS